MADGSLPSVRSDLDPDELRGSTELLDAVASATCTGRCSASGVADRLQTGSTSAFAGLLVRRRPRGRRGRHNVSGAVDDKKMDFRILGSFEVRSGGRLVGLGGEKPRALLAILVLHRNEVVSADRLVDDLWGESPPETALRTLQAYVSRLRKALGPNGASPSEDPESASVANGGVLLTRGRGYVLEVAPGELDLERFRELAEHGRDALAGGNPEEAATVLSEALGIWRGSPLADFAYELFA